MSSQSPSINPTAYVGVRPTNPPNIWFRNRAPINSLDVNNYFLGDEWIWSVAGLCWKLMSLVNLPNGGKLANWVSIVGGGGGGGIQTLTCDNAVVVPPTAGNVNLAGAAAQGVQTSGNAGTSTCTVSVQNADTAGNKGVVTLDPTVFAIEPSGETTIYLADTAGQLGVSDYNPAMFNVAAGTVSANLAGVNGPVGVSSYTSSQFNVSPAGLVSLTGSNPVRPCFSAGKTAQANNITGNGAQYQIVFDQVFFNQGSYYNPATGIFTAPVAGIYSFSAGAILDAGIGFAMVQVYMDIVPSSGMIIQGDIFASTGVGENANIGVYANGLVTLPALATVYVRVAGIGLAGNTAYMYGNGPGTSGVVLQNYFHGYQLC